MLYEARRTAAAVPVFPLTLLLVMAILLSKVQLWGCCSPWIKDTHLNVQFLLKKPWTQWRKDTATNKHKMIRYQSLELTWNNFHNILKECFACHFALDFNSTGISVPNSHYILFLIKRATHIVSKNIFCKSKVTKNNAKYTTVCIFVL